MIDVENIVFDAVSTDLESEYENIFVTSEYVETPSEFPCVSIVESDSSVSMRDITTSEIEVATDVAYVVNIYDNSVNLKKGVVKAIANTLDDTMNRLGFVRTMLQPTPNVDRSVYRMTGRYIGRVKRTPDGTDTFKVYGR